MGDETCQFFVKICNPLSTLKKSSLLFPLLFSHNRPKLNNNFLFPVLAVFTWHIFSRELFLGFDSS